MHGKYFWPCIRTAYLMHPSPPISKSSSEYIAHTLVHEENREGDRKKEIWCDPFERFTRRGKVPPTWSESGIFHESSALFLTGSFSALRDWLSGLMRVESRVKVSAFLRAVRSPLLSESMNYNSYTLYTLSLSLMSREGWTRSDGRHCSSSRTDRLIFIKSLSTWQKKKFLLDEYIVNEAVNKSSQINKELWDK